MSGKKNDERFNNPFSALKGLSVSGGRKPEKKDRPAAEKPAVPEVPQPEPEADFFAEMKDLGVREIERSGLEKRPPRRDDGSAAASGPAEGRVRTGAGGGAASARREKRLRRGDIRAEAELDLHGVRAGEVRQKVAWFLENAVFHGFAAVRIVTGKGSRSDEGPILRPLVEDYLDGPGRTYVVEWLRAPQKQGGEGAIIAFLRQG